MLSSMAPEEEQGGQADAQNRHRCLRGEPKENVNAVPCRTSVDVECGVSAYTHVKSAFNAASPVVTVTNLPMDITMTLCQVSFRP